MPNDNFKFEPTVRGIVERIAYQMGDAEPGCEYEGLDSEWITARVFDTFKWLQGRRPNLFANEIEFDLKPGSNQAVAEECDKLIEILAVTIKGKEYPVQKSDYESLRASQAYSKLTPTCLSDLCVFHAGISEIDARRFLFSPPVSPAKPMTVRATCSDMSRFFDDPDKEIDCDVAKWINTVVEYVLYQAFSMDGDNQISASLADQHRATFFDLAPVQRRERSE